MVKPTYKFYSDSGHGWLAVKRQELIDMGILHKITHYSYQRGATVYLEEDCDATTFFNAKGLNTHGDIRLTMNLIEKHCNRSPIRSYESFKA